MCDYRSDAIIEGCEFQGSGRSGGAYMSRSSPTIRQCYFHDCGIAIEVAVVECAPLISNNHITRSRYAGIFLNGNSGNPSQAGLHWPVITGNLIYGNGGEPDNWWTYPKGGIIGSATAIITGNTLCDNTGVGVGRLQGWSTDAVRMYNNIISGNSAHGVLCTDAAVELGHNNVWGNTVNYAGCIPSPNDISSDPQFTDRNGGDYSLAPSSPCIDTGNNAAPGLQVHDIAGNLRVIDGDSDGTAIVDIGAYESLPTNVDPLADAGQDVVVECGGSTGTAVTLDARGSSDPDGDDLTYEWSGADITFDDANSATPTAMFPPGVTIVTLTVSDGHGGIDCDDVWITVVDTTPPLLACTTDLIAIGPPNHKMVPVEILLFASDTCDDPESFVVVCRVQSNEPDDARGDGESTGDVDGYDGYTNPVNVELAYDSSSGMYVGTLYLRAERNGSKTGRSYSILCEAEDSAGNLNSASCVVVVPHDRRKN